MCFFMFDHHRCGVCRTHLDRERNGCSPWRPSRGEKTRRRRPSRLSGPGPTRELGRGLGPRQWQRHRQGSGRRGYAKKTNQHGRGQPRGHFGRRFLFLFPCQGGVCMCRFDDQWSDRGLRHRPHGPAPRFRRTPLFYRGQRSLASASAVEPVSPRRGGHVHCVEDRWTETNSVSGVSAWTFTIDIAANVWDEREPAHPTSFTGPCDRVGRLRPMLDPPRQREPRRERERGQGQEPAWEREQDLWEQPRFVWTPYLAGHLTLPLPPPPPLPLPLHWPLPRIHRHPLFRLSRRQQLPRPRDRPLFRLSRPRRLRPNQNKRPSPKGA
jgi:hypothetical protein